MSQANVSRPHWEVQIAADPTDAKRLIACSKLLGDDQSYLRSWPDDVVVYNESTSIRTVLTGALAG